MKSEGFGKSSRLQTGGLKSIENPALQLNEASGGCSGDLSVVLGEGNLSLKNNKRNHAHHYRKL
ncbi:MAG: hypothetical protein H7844_01120 [Nitrospirae bacterium YQR-1]